MSLGHARPRLTHMPHQIAEREQEAAAKIRYLQAGLTPMSSCEVCGKPGPFGFNNFLRAPELAVFACRDHREEVAQALE
ncbi:hypothetical protein ASF58_23285 [Methylobacterium sp. Leaf125]|uniref:hypothetical protein n=1 Tax=Methylobacterium sp. Leaf125 TaxID=1736265 RepID=UPI0006F4FD81|nr:hypothetical protein [Methylobacterium sp. Leaf125]KQQ39067.1 hypothetical protein ASF58_23285 [Methylobacterium sp. Leaf125]